MYEYKETDSINWVKSSLKSHPLWVSCTYTVNTYIYTIPNISLLYSVYKIEHEYSGLIPENQLVSEETKQFIKGVPRCFQFIIKCTGCLLIASILID